MSSMSCPSSSDPQPFRLLDLPPELRHQILTYLFPPSTLSKLNLRSLFIRTHFRNVYMTQQTKALNASLPVLRVCRTITAECLPLLYGLPMWRCATRIELLGSQIGLANFSMIRRMEIGFEDLEMIVATLTEEGEDGGSGGAGSGSSSSSRRRRQRLTFNSLEVLETEGYRPSALFPDESKMSGRKNMVHRTRIEALKLCELAAKILALHPKLQVLSQQEGLSGGADAMDLGLGRVKWRFAKSVHVLTGEHIVDIHSVTEVLKGLLQNELRSSEAAKLVTWMEDGRYRQYPHLISG